MSSLQKSPTGYRIQFRLKRKPHTLSLGSVRKTEAEKFQLHIDRLLLAASGRGQLSAIGLDWIKQAPDELRSKLKSLGLVENRQQSETSLVSAVDDYCDTMRTWTPATIAAWKTHRRRSFLYFANRGYEQISAGDCRDFKQFLLSLPLAENSARKTIGCMRQVCQWLIDHERLTKNPFTGQPVGISVAKKRSYVPADVVERVIDHCHDSEWKMMFILARYGGLRCPSETKGLRWTDIDWERQRFVVVSPKTKRHPKGESRVVPLFPDLRRHLEPIWHELPDGAEWMFPRLRHKSKSLHAPATKLVMAAKEALWPRIFHNMRSSCQTDLTDIHPLAAVCAWLGNSATVAARHYLQVTEAHFEAAVKSATGQGAIVSSTTP